MGIRVGMKVAPGVYASTRVGGRRRGSRKPSKGGSAVASVIGLVAVLGFALAHPWVLAVVLPLGSLFFFCVAVRGFRRNRARRSRLQVSASG